MNAYLLTFKDEEPDCAYPVVISDDYDGVPHGETVPFAVGSNQTIVTEDDGYYWWNWCSGYCKGAGDYDRGARPQEWSH